METQPMNDNTRIKEFFKGSYGKLYRGDEAFDNHFLKHMTQLIETEQAMAILIGNRISAVATSLEAESRMQTMIELLNECKKANGLSWISVGVEYKSMQYACSQANMLLIDDELVLRHLLTTTILEDTYKITKDNGTLHIAKQITPDYKQVVYL